MQSSLVCAQPLEVTSNVITMQVGATIVSGPTGNGSGWEGSIMLYPNPSGGHFTIAADWSVVHIGKRVDVDMVNGLGQRVYHTELQPDRGKWSTEVWLDESIANGTYLIRIYSEDGMKTNVPVVIKR